MQHRSENSERRPTPDGHLEGWYEFVGASLLGSGLGWGLSFLGSYVPLLNRELVKAQLTLSLLVVALVVTLAVSIVKLHFAWLANQSPYHAELAAYRKIWPNLSELALWSSVAFISLGSVMVGAWLLRGIDVPLSLPVLFGISITIASWTKAWLDARDSRIRLLLDGRDGLANWLEHYPGRPAHRRGSWRTYELLLTLPVVRTRHYVLSWCLGGIAFSFAWGFGAYTSALGIVTTLLIPATLSVLLLLGLVFALGIAVWSGAADAAAQQAKSQWEQNSEKVLQAPTSEQPASVYLGERSDLAEMFAKHPDYGGKEVGDEL